MTGTFWVDTAKRLDARDSINFMLWNTKLYIKIVRKLTGNDYVGAQHEIPIEKLASAIDQGVIVDHGVDECLLLINKEEAKWRASQ